VSRQRVHQLIKKHGINLPGARQESQLVWTCAKCGEVRNGTRWTIPRGDLCVPCREAATHVVIVCPTCGKARRITRSHLRYYKTEQCQPCFAHEHGVKIGNEIGRYNFLAYHERRRREREAANEVSPIPATSATGGSEEC
jgi:RNase P subunit RPR2